MKFSQEVREIIHQRAKDRCEVCGIIVHNGQIHHRRPRGMGGSKDPLSGTAANGVLLHPSCHAMIESDRERAAENGWLVKQGHDPAYVPFRKYNGWVMLNTDGTTTTAEPIYIQ